MALFSSAAQWLVARKLSTAPPLSQVEALGAVVVSKKTVSSQGRLFLGPLRQRKGCDCIPMKPTMVILKDALAIGGTDSIKDE